MRAATRTRPGCCASAGEGWRRAHLAAIVLVRATRREAVRLVDEEHAALGLLHLLARLLPRLPNLRSDEIAPLRYRLSPLTTEEGCDDWLTFSRAAGTLYLPTDSKSWSFKMPLRY